MMRLLTAKEIFSRVLSCGAGLCLALAGCNRAPSGPTAYGQKVRFSEGRILQFPDFSLEYTGQNKVSLPRYPRGFIYYNFVVKSNGKEEKIRWSSGTGLIGPLDFSVGAKSFLLELKMSSVLGSLDDNELVVWPQKEWQLKQPKTAR